MAALPAGTITMLFSDIEGSTALLNRLGDRYGEALSTQRALLRAAFAASGGQEMGTEGDSFFVVFESAGDAVGCCVAAQCALSRYEWPGGAAVRVRMGLHSGEPVRHEDGYVGLDVHRAARIAAAAHGGQVVVSEATRLLVGQRLPAGASFRDLGYHRLKDIEEPERMYQLLAPGLPESFPPLRSLGAGVAVAGKAAGMHGFPPALTSLVGRDGELAAIADLLARHRLVTVTGPGGVGKTRLAAEVARGVVGRFADGVWLVELTGAGDPALVPTAAAAALGVEEARGTSVMEALAEALVARQALVVLDNCEHMIAAVAGLCGVLLSADDDVRVLATSREPVGLAGEARYRLTPLSLPHPGEAGRSGAATLFAERARQLDPHFTVNAETAPAVDRLVTRLDGIPLAIELAAARVEALGIGQLLERLDDQFSLLASGDRLAAPRHRSLAATVKWSYQLLSEQERRVFRWVSVFSGRFSLDAAEAVAGADAGPAVLRLVDCSLLVPPRAGPDGRARYLMLDTLRAYGARRLAEAGEDLAAAAALTRYALQVAEQAASDLATSGREMTAGRWLDAEDATAHQALAWALEHESADALRLGTALAPWWFLRGRWATGYELLAAAAGPAVEGSAQWCAAQFWLGLLSAGSQVTTSFGHLSAVRDVLTSGAPTPLLAQVLAWRAGCLANLGRLPEAAEEGRHALALARELSDPAGEAGALYWLGLTASYRGDAEECAAWMRQFQRVDRTAIPGWIARHGMILLADALGEVRDLADAQRYCAQALDLARQAGALYDQGQCLNVMARLDLLAGQLTQARTHAKQALEMYFQTSTGILLINCLEVCAELCIATRRWPQAVTVRAALDAVNQATMGRVWLVPDESERQDDLQEAREALDPSQLRAAKERGAAMTPATAAEYARMLVTEETDEPDLAPAFRELTPRERALVTLVAEGHTNAEIAAQLSVSVRTVGSRLEQIRHKTGSRRRADLTRLALRTGLV